VRKRTWKVGKPRRQTVEGRKYEMVQKLATRFWGFLRVFAEVLLCVPSVFKSKEGIKRGGFRFSVFLEQLVVCITKK
jgi:hypothetical protein